MSASTPTDIKMLIVSDRDALIRQQAHTFSLAFSFLYITDDGDDSSTITQPSSRRNRKIPRNALFTSHSISVGNHNHPQVMECAVNILPHLTTQYILCWTMQCATKHDNTHHLYTTNGTTKGKKRCIALDNVTRHPSGIFYE